MISLEKPMKLPSAKHDFESKVSVDPVEVAKTSLRDVAMQLLKLASSIDHIFADSVEAIIQCSGRVIVIGMGKSGIVGKKIAATLASTGTSSFFIHPGEAYHGDLGMIQPQDIVLLLSNSGETSEVKNLLRPIKSFGNKTIAIVGDANSTIGRQVDYCLEARVDQEICPLNLAPTSSTTAAMVLGDALAVALMKKRDFAPEQFARFHPGGSLGRRLLTQVKDVMLSENLPLVTPTQSLEDVVFKMTGSAIGIAIVHEERRLKGVITDTDLRVAFSSIDSIKSTTAADVMTRNPRTISECAPVIDAKNFLQEYPCRALVVLDINEEIVGLYGRDIFN